MMQYICEQKSIVEMVIEKIFIIILLWIDGLEYIAHFSKLRHRLGPLCEIEQ